MVSVPGAHRSIDRITARALLVWSAAVCVYIVAITGRTSFGVAGVHAIEHFGLDASRLAVFTSVQVGVYALAQIPVGLLVDRFGARRILLVGALIMATGQIILCLTGSYGVAIGARVLIGTGDATAFLSVMRLLPLWFPMRWTPVLSQLTGGLGTFGQFLSAVPFLLLLDTAGWAVAFCSLGAVGVLVALAAAVFVRDQPTAAAGAAQTAASPGIGRRLRMVLTDPYSWQGVFTHWTNMGPVMVFLLLWGAPTMTLGLGLGSAEVGLLWTLLSVTTVIAGPVSGVISARIGERRALFSLCTALVQGMLWALLFLPAEPPGNPLLFVTVITVLIFLVSPAGNFGFDIVRERMDRSVLATGTGLTNMGAYICAMLATQLIGFLLDSRAPGGDYDWTDFRFGWLGLALAWAAGMLGLLCSMAVIRRRNRRPVLPAVTAVIRTEGSEGAE